MNLLIRLATFAIFTFTVLQAHAIDCKSAAGKTEMLICKDDELVRLDDSLNQLYRVVIAKSGRPAKVKLEEKHWISETRSSCNDSACLKRTYTSRLDALQKEMSPWCQSQKKRLGGSWIRVGDDGFFEEFSMGPDGEFDSWLHQRPEISGGTWRLVECNFIVQDNSGLEVQWVITNVTKSELRAIDIGVGTVIYRRTQE